MSATHQTAKTQYVDHDGIKYAYRRFGKPDGVPLVFLIHFRGTMDLWDPLLINSIAATRPVILVDNAGVGKSTGAVPNTIKGMADHIIKFLAAIKVPTVDIIGFSMGGMAAQMVALNSSKIVRKLIIAGSGPDPAEDVVVKNSPKVFAKIFEMASNPQSGWETFSYLFFSPSETSQAAGQAWWKRVAERNPSTSGEERSNAVCSQNADGGAGTKAMVEAFQTWRDPAHRADGSFDRLNEITIPVFVANGQNDVMIPTQNSYILQQKLPNARLKLFPDSGHGFLYQFAEEFADDVNKFLDSV